MKKIAIVTGASAGMGVEFAKQVDSRFKLDEIWLIARREDRLKALAKELKRAKGIVVKADLTKDMDKIVSKLKNEKPNIKALINNAGFGKKGLFQDISLESQEKMIDLNIKALVSLTYESIKYMGKESKIIQIASSAGYAPLPKFNVYAATKAFVLNFGCALNGELKSEGIHTITVCPGPVKTEFFEVAGGQSTLAGFADSKDVVEKAFDDLERNKWISIYTGRIKLMALLMKLLPRKWVVKMVAKMR